MRTPTLSLFAAFALASACKHDTDDTGTPDDTGDDTGIAWVAVHVTADPETLTTREQVTLQLEAEDEDGEWWDVTDEAVFASSDSSILEFYEPEIGQPILDGVVTLTGSWGGMEDSVDVTIALAEVEAGDVVFNEILADATVDGDPNGDRITDEVEDEFVEIANAAGITVDLSGALLVEPDWTEFLPRHTFADGTVLRAGEAVVVFGGGDVAALSADYATFVVADNDDPGTPAGLSLEDAGETLRLLASDGTTEITRIAYGSDAGGTPPAPADQSLVLVPEVTGSDYAEHTSATGSIGAFSPGTHADGSPFEGPDAFYRR